MHKKPIILIPGIQGTKLANTNEKDFKTVWSGIKKYFSNIHILQLQFNGKDDKGAENIIEHIDVENMAYSEIINYLRSLGYRVFIFGYDWRKSNQESASELSDFVRKIQRKLNEPKVNFLTHSMGGLVLSAYFKTLTKDELNSTINKSIFSVPPFLGSIEASFNLTIGKSRFINSSDDFRKIGRTFPGIYELLPVYNSAYHFEDPLTKNEFNVFKFDTYWQRIKDVTKTKTEQKHRLMTHRLKELEDIRNQDNFIFNLKNCSEELREKMVVLAGAGEKTKETIYVEKQKNDYINYFNYEKFDDSEDGDGTVPIPSSTAFKEFILTLKIYTTWLEKRADSRYIMADWHAFFLNNGRVQNIIKRFFEPNKTLADGWYESKGEKDKIEKC